MDRGFNHARVHGVTKSGTRLSDRRLTLSHSLAMSKFYSWNVMEMVCATSQSNP